MKGSQTGRFRQTRKTSPQKPADLIVCLLHQSAKTTDKISRPQVRRGHIRNRQFRRIGRHAQRHQPLIRRCPHISPQPLSLLHRETILRARQTTHIQHGLKLRFRFGLAPFKHPNRLQRRRRIPHVFPSSYFGKRRRIKPEKPHKKWPNPFRRRPLVIVHLIPTPFAPNGLHPPHPILMPLQDIQLFLCVPGQTLLHGLVAVAQGLSQRMAHEGNNAHVGLFVHVRREKIPGFAPVVIVHLARVLCADDQFGGCASGKPNLKHPLHLPAFKTSFNPKRRRLDIQQSPKQHPVIDHVGRVVRQLGRQCPPCIPQRIMGPAELILQKRRARFVGPDVKNDALEFVCHCFSAHADRR